MCSEARSFISIPLPKEQKEQFQRAAVASGKTVAAWLRDLGAREVAVPYVVVETGPAYEIPPRPRLENAGHERRKTAAEIAAGIPGVSLGTGAAIVVGDGIATWDGPAEDVPTRSWLPELTALMRRAEFENVEEDFRALYGGEFRPPKGWANWSVDTRAAWLDKHHPLEAK